MVALNFAPVMAPKVANLIKLQTIRDYRKDGRDPEEFDRLQLYTGLRRPGARKLIERDPLVEIAAHIDIEDRRGERYEGAPLCSVMAVWPRGGHRYIDGDLRIADARELDAFARADGFENFDRLLAWFCPDGKPFRGTLTHWRHDIRTIVGWRP